MIQPLRSCFLILCIPAAFALEIDNIEMNNKCTYSANKRILDCVELENVNKNLGQFITSRTQMVFLRSSKSLYFNINHHIGPNYSNLVSYQILNSQSFLVNPGAFLGLFNLQYMEFHGNIWNEIQDNTFIGLGNLEVLNLANNQIKKMNPDAFNQLSKLKNLDLSDNSLEIIPFYVFETLTGLESLYINNNRINTIQENAFLGLASLNMLYLTNNSLRHIDTNEFNKLKKLEHLNVNFNQIRSIYGHFSLAKLQFFQASKNDLKEIEETIFEQCPELSSVDLSFNKLGLLTEKPFLSLYKLRHLNLYGNFINLTKFSEINRYATIIHN